jgi:glutaredoxin
MNDIGIVILGKSNCGKCQAAKDKIERLGLEYVYVAMDEPNGWKRKVVTEAMGCANQQDMDIGRPPIIVIDNQAFEYAAAMKTLKAKLHR